MNISTDYFIIIIQFLDLLCLNILRPAVPPTILKSGGTLFDLGILTSASVVTHMISTKLLNELEKVFGTKKLLKYSLISSSLINGSLLFTSTAYQIILNRILFTFAYQVPVLCGKLENKELRKDGFYKNLRLQGLMTVFVGCATVGSLIDSKGGFYVVTTISTVIAFISTVAILQLETDEKPDEKQKKNQTTLTAISKTFDNIKNSITSIDIDFKNWEAFLIKYLLISNSTVVHILFVVLIIFVFRGNGKIVCSVGAYQALVAASIEYFFEKINGFVKNYGNSKKILEYSALICAISAIFAGFAPSIVFYCAMFIPLVISRRLAETHFVEVYEIRKNQKLSADIISFSKITEIVSPLINGLLFQLLKPNAYRLISIGTMLAIYFIVKSKSKYEKIKINSSDNKKNKNE